MCVSHSWWFRFQKQEWTTTAAPRCPVSKFTTLPVNFLEACMAHHNQGFCNLGPMSLGEHRAYPLCCDFLSLSDAVSISQNTPYPTPAWVNKCAPVRYFFHSSCQGSQQIPEGGPHEEVRPKPMLRSRGCETKEDERKPLHAAMQAVDWITKISLLNPVSMK